MLHHFTVFSSTANARTYVFASCNLSSFEIITKEGSSSLMFFSYFDTVNVILLVVNGSN